MSVDKRKYLQQKKEKILFPIIVTIVVSLIVPPAATLVGMLMLGNLFRECGVVGRLEDTAKNALINNITIFLGVTVGATATAEQFLKVETLVILTLGIIAFAIGTASRVLIAKLMNKVLKVKINPLIGSAGVSAVPWQPEYPRSLARRRNPPIFSSCMPWGQTLPVLSALQYLQGFYFPCLETDLVIQHPNVALFSAE